MAKYTITIKSLIDNNFDFQMNSYPIFDEGYRKTLNKNILNHYYENEIGFETAPLFRFYLNQTLNEIMPKYNEMYKAQKYIFENNLLTGNVDLTESFNRSNITETTTDSNSSSKSSSETNNKNLFQDTPQGEISHTDFENQKWATNMNLDKNNTSSSINDTSKNSGNSNTKEKYIKNISGNNGNKYSIDILEDLKNKLINIDLLIIDDLKDLFMQIF